MTDGRRPERPSGERGARPHLLQPARVLALGFAALIAAGTVTLSLEPMHAPAARVTLLDALFTATSAVCVTGLTVVNTASAWSPLGQLVIALLIQAGGLGVMTLSTLVAFAIGRRITFRERILIRESLGQYEVAGVVRLTRAILLLTVLFELTGALVLTLAFSRDYPWPRAAALGLFHAVSAFNNAGFDLFGDSLIRFRSDPLVNLTVMALIVLGGLGFTVVLELFSWLRCRRPLSLHTKCVLVFTGLLIVGGTLLLAAAEWSNQATLGALPPAVRWLAASFHAVSARTAGFNTLPMDAFRPGALFILTLLMFIGASPGGTGGGVKTTTVAVVLASVWATITGRGEPDAFGRRIGREVVDRALAVSVISFLLVVVMTLALLAAEDVLFLQALFEVVSAFGTVGLSTGITSDLSPVGRLIIIATMYAGRVGPLTLAAAIAHVQARQRAFRYPEEKVMVG